VEFKSAVVAGAGSWNGNVRNVRLVEAAPGATAQIRIVAFDGWPQATLGPVRPSGARGTVWIGRQAVSQGYNTVRIAAHELRSRTFGRRRPDFKPVGPTTVHEIRFRNGTSEVVG
jgi:snapalysin